MYGIIGEDKSDVATLKVFLKRLLNDNTVTIRTKGYSGCAQMLCKGASQVDLFSKLGVKIFIICYDADSDNPKDRYAEVVNKIIEMSAQRKTFCVLIPVQELEAWILADIPSVSNVFTGWRPHEINNPENIHNPKEYLEKLSRTANKKPRYNHAMHNEMVAKYLDLDIVHRKCPSFKPLMDLAHSGRGNY